MGKKGWPSFLWIAVPAVILVTAFFVVPIFRTTLDSHNDKTRTTAPITFSYFIGDPGYVPERTKVGDIIETDTGVTVKYERLTGELKANLGVMIASRDYPDFIFGQNQMGTLVDAKALIPLEDLIEANAPNLKQLYSGVWKRLKDPLDGHIYILPFGVPQGQSIPDPKYSPAFWIQKQVLKELNYPKILTLDGYFGAIERYKQAHPVTGNEPTIGYEILTADWRDFTLRTPQQFLAGYPNDSRGLVNPLEGFKVNNFAADDISKRWYRKLNEEYRKGIVDPEAFVMNYEQYLDKLKSGRVLGMFDHGWQFLVIQDELKRQGKYMQMYVPLPIVFDSGITDDYLGPSTINYGQGLGITVKCKDPVRAIQYLDYMAKLETQVLVSWGVKGTDYDVVNGRFVRNPEQRKRFSDKSFADAFNGGNLFYYYPNVYGTMPDGNAFDSSQQPEEIGAVMDESDKELLKAYHVTSYRDMFTPEKQVRKYYPLWTVELSDKGKEFEQQSERLTRQAVPKLVLAKSDEEFEDVWQQYRSNITGLDVEGYNRELFQRVMWRQENW